MPWQERSTMDVRREFVELARQEGANVRELCRRYQISPKTAYKWLGRFAQQGEQATALADRSCRPLSSPLRSSSAVEQAVVCLRQQHPGWGGRKIAKRLAVLQQAQLAPSTVTGILHRHGLIHPEASEQATPWQRFEHEQPNLLWQIDFKGDFLTFAGKCYPLTLIDDHSRFNLALTALARAGTPQVQPLLEQVMRRYGMPQRINSDNGPPWGAPSAHDHGLSALGVWLIRLGVRISHSRAYHPQTNGKIERFHRSLQREVLHGRAYCDHAEVQRDFDAWRMVYNCERPHEALAMATPALRYRPSALAFPDRLPEIAYPDGDTVVTVGWNGIFKFKGRRWRTSSALHQLPIALRPDIHTDGLFHGYFCRQPFMTLDLRQDRLQT
ncbi:IS481 family transposase [Ideonella sp. BN130291]|uniref:IS481 family transposase n=1 Tax=Ideonella sp. BN130291 TaxID=3112940 RepID=UPI002E2697F5|nr:IS481 family transposase [Ideonella sp. BN130291]